MHAFLITGGRHDDRAGNAMELCKEWRVHPNDTLRLKVPEDKQSIGISDVKEAVRFIHLSPRQSALAILIIEDAHLLTPEAAQALLKTLEEPPATVRIILEAPQEEMLIPTIISRCQHVRIKKSIDTDEALKENVIALIQHVPGKRIGEIIKYVDESYKDKEEATLFLETFLLVARENLLSLQSVSEIRKNTAIIRSLLRAKKELASNVNFRLVLDKFFLFYTGQRS